MTKESLFKSTIFFLASWFTLENVNAQGLIITEMSQGESGNKEYIELLVVNEDKCNLVDLRSWIVDDNNGNFGPNGISRGYLKFTDDVLWSRMMSGTTILLWNIEDTSTLLQTQGLDILDIDPNDFRIIIPVGCKNVGTAQQTCPTSQYIVGVTNIPTTTNPSYNNPFVLIATTFRWNNLIPFGNSSNGDGAQTRKPDGSFFMGFAYGANNLHPLSPIYGNNSLRFNPGANTYSLTNQFSQDYNDKQNWSTGTSRSPAIANSIENLEYNLSIQVDNDCALNIKFPEDESDNPENQPTDNKITLVKYYNLLGQETEILYNKILIKETLYQNNTISRNLIIRGN